MYRSIKLFAEDKTHLAQVSCGSILHDNYCVQSEKCDSNLKPNSSGHKDKHILQKHLDTCVKEQHANSEREMCLDY